MLSVREGSRSFIEHGGGWGASFTYATSLNPHVVNIMPIFGRQSWWGGIKIAAWGFQSLSDKAGWLAKSWGAAIHFEQAYNLF